MKVKVIKKFKDIHTKKIHKVGKVMDISKERYEEILKTGDFVEEVKKEELPDEEPETPKDKDQKKENKK